MTEAKFIVGARNSSSLLLRVRRNYATNREAGSAKSGAACRTNPSMRLVPDYCPRSRCPS